MQRHSKMDQVINRNRRRPLVDILVSGLTHGGVLATALMILAL